MEQSWGTFLNSLSPNFLQHTVEVTSGNYCSSDELSFSNGDIISIVDLVPTEVKADLYQYGSAVKLKTITIPLSYEGLFRMLPDPDPFATVADLIQSVRLVKKREMYPRFQSTSAIVGDGVEAWIKSRETIALVGIEERTKGRYLECKLIKRRSPLTVWLPMSCPCMFLECPDDEHYSIDTIVNWKILKGRNRMLQPSVGFHDSRLIPVNFSGYLVLHPSFSAQAVLEGGEEILMPSNLDVSITECFSMKNPQMLSEIMDLSEIYNLPEGRFPITVRIVDVVAKSKNKRLQLTRGQRLRILGKDSVDGHFISEDSEMSLWRRCFFVPQTYQGLVNRRSREFKFVYDVFLASSSGEEIIFKAGQRFTAEASELSSFKSGEVFRTIRNAMVTARINGTEEDIEVLECESITTKSIVWLPFYAGCQFMELLDDKANYKSTIKQMASAHRLPCHINVVMQDPSLSSDPLYNISKLKIDKFSCEDCLVAKHINSESTFKLTVDLMKMLVCIVTEGSMESTSKAESNLPSFDIVEIPTTQYLLDVDYEEIHKPPPRPPKSNHLSGNKVSSPTGTSSLPTLFKGIHLKKKVPAGSVTQGTPLPTSGNSPKDSSTWYQPQFGCNQDHP